MFNIVRVVNSHDIGIPKEYVSKYLQSKLIVFIQFGMFIQSIN